MSELFELVFSIHCMKIIHRYRSRSSEARGLGFIHEIHAMSNDDVVLQLLCWKVMFLSGWDFIVTSRKVLNFLEGLGFSSRFRGSEVSAVHGNQRLHYHSCYAFAYVRLGLLHGRYCKARTSFIYLLSKTLGIC